MDENNKIHDEETITAKLNFYKNKDIELHITKKNGSWMNCFIIEESSTGVYVVKERKFGIMHLFFSEIASVEEVVRKL